MSEDYFTYYSPLLGEINDFNDRQFTEFDVSPQGVGWNSVPAQVTRFENLLRILEPNATKSASLNDIGCGYGALVEHLLSRNMRLDYRGYEVSSKLLAKARDLHPGPFEWPVIFNPLHEITPATYTVASGIFGMRFSHSDQFWHSYVQATLDLLNDNSILGFAFNLLTSYCDADKKKNELFYADPCFFFDLCKRRYSKNVALYHDYSLYDFTIIVRKC